MKDILKKLIYLILFLIFTNLEVFAQNYSIDYYGIISNELDNNMAKMTSDLYYTQLSELDNFSINDMRTTASRTTIPDFNSIKSDNLIFYSTIEEKDTENWIVTFILLDKKTNQQYSKSKTYDTFYKILIESKNELKETIKELVNGNSDKISPDDKKNVNNILTEEKKKIILSSAEPLSGTWEGEDSIDKIVILRGGRGFVFFNNGAHMNITITLETKDTEQLIVIQQKGNPNASYYPELPRKIALDAAITAPPINWTMTLYEDMVMKGIKNTLIPDNSSYKQGSIPVIWKKIN